MSLVPGLLALAAVSCASSAKPSLPPPQEGTAPRVEVDYQPELGHVVVKSDRPVYVAVFGVGEARAPWLIYPTRAHRVARVEPGNPLRVTERYTKGLPRQRIGAGNYSRSNHGLVIKPTEADGEVVDRDIETDKGSYPPLRVYVIASTEPLRTDEMVDRGTVASHQAFEHRAIEPKLNVLLDRVLTTSDEKQWTDVSYVIWP